MSTRVDWRFGTWVSGVSSVMITGIWRMRRSSANNLDISMFLILQKTNCAILNLTLFEYFLKIF